ncbi:hypothetical protein [Persicitalea sp.]|uniref:hypothetical protein n=1 Tax=Persicitalea sp. TaxID=3100273 RepID=UPI0035945684
MKYLLYMILAIFASVSCLREATCEDIAAAYRPDEISMIVTVPAESAYSFRLKGVSLENRIVTFVGGNYLWALDFNDHISKGDTVIKKRGELKFFIHKKDSVMVFNLECEGVILE